jgi:hypothetical protein
VSVPINVHKIVQLAFSVLEIRRSLALRSSFARATRLIANNDVERRDFSYFSQSPNKRSRRIGMVLWMCYKRIRKSCTGLVGDEPVIQPQIVGQEKRRAIG